MLHFILMLNYGYAMLIPAGMLRYMLSVWRIAFCEHVFLDDKFYADPGCIFLMNFLAVITHDLKS